MAKIDWGSDEEFISNYFELKSSRKMGELYHCDKTSVLNHAKQIGFQVADVQTFKLNEQQKLEIANAYETCTSTELAKKYNVSRGMITKVWYDYNLKGKKYQPEKTAEINMAGQVIGKWTVLYKTDRRNAGGLIYWHCRCECGREKDVLGSSLRNRTSLSCGLHSNISRGNVKIAELLDKANIPYETEKIFETCKDKKGLPFDFYVDNSYLIEFDGKQHFDNDSIFDYETTHRHDIMKNEWCKQNNIPLIRVPFTQYEQLTIEDLLLDTSNFKI